MSIHRSVGVDFGTSTSLVAEGSAGRQPRVFPIGATTSALPSLVGLDAAGVLVVGDAAADLAVDRVRRSVKRCITRRLHEVQLPDGTGLDADEAICALLADIALRARVGGVDLSPESTRLGCPAMWDGDQRMRLLDLAEQAGLPVSDHTLIDEPVAAGVAWVNAQVQRTGARRTISGKLLVFDMGGGTLDVALLEVHAEPGEVAEISVLSSWGRDEAGDALDTSIASDLAVQLAEQGVDPDEVDAHGDLVLQAARQAKLQLSRQLETVVDIRSPRVRLPATSYTREQLDAAFADQLGRAEQLVWSVLRGARVTHQEVLSPAEIRALPQAVLARDVDHVLLVGGMSRIPAVTRMIERVLPGVDLHLTASTADEAIVAGLAETVAYDRINLHRPPLDFVLEYDEGGQHRRVPVYEAYSPFYPPYFAMTRSILYHEWSPHLRDVPRQGTATLSIYTPGGELLPLRIDDTEGVIQVRFGHRPPSVRIYPNGRVVVVDGRGRVTELLVPRWPVIRGKDHAFLLAQRNEKATPSLVERPYMRDPLFNH